MTFKQKDIIWINFDPSKGREIQKRRPALVLSSDNYIKSTNFVIVAPITSTIRKLPSFYSLDEKYKTKGQVVCQQLYSYDISKSANRHAEYIETLEDDDFYQIAQIVKWNFNFNI